MTIQNQTYGAEDKNYQYASINDGYMKDGVSELLIWFEHCIVAIRIIVNSFESLVMPKFCRFLCLATI